MKTVGLDSKIRNLTVTKSSPGRWVGAVGSDQKRVESPHLVFMKNNHFVAGLKQ